MTAGFQRERLARPHPGTARPALHAMLEARSVALVGASGRTGSFGARMVAEVAKSTARPDIYLVNPRYDEIAGLRCYPSIADLPSPVDLVLLGVPDGQLEAQLALAASRGDRSAVIFGNAHGTGEAHSIRQRPERGDSGRGLNASRPDHLAPDADGDPAEGVLGDGDAGRRAGLRQRLAAIAGAAGMELCGAGCMGFANVGYGLRAMGYVEPDPLPAGPVALVTHSGSVFSALLRSRRAIGFTLAVSSGQELITAAPSYLRYALEQPETRVLALVLEAIRQPDQLRDVLAAAAQRDLPVVLLTAGTSASGQAMVTAHSGALAAADGGWEALARAYGIHRVGDLAELADTVELFALRSRSGRKRPAPNDSNGTLVSQQRRQWHIGVVGATRGIATVHDSGLERAHVADVASELGVPFAAIGEATRARLTDLLDPGLLPGNPLDVWGTGANTRQLFADSLVALAQDEAVAAVALAVDLATELDGDDAYQLAVLDAAAQTDKPLAVVSNLPGVIDADVAALLRREGIPVLEGTRTGLLALRHLLDQQAAEARTGGSNNLPGHSPASRPADPGHSGRRARALELLAAGQQSGEPQLALLRQYGIATARTQRVTDADGAVAAADRIGYPVVLKTDERSIAHKSDAHGVILGVETAAQLSDAYADLAARLGPAVLVCEQVHGGVELTLGIVRDHALGPLLVVGAGGVLVELLADRVVALPPVGPKVAAELLSGLRVRKLLDGVRGAPPADLDAIVRAITGLSQLALELGDELEALDINPLICGRSGAIAVDALVIRSLSTS